MMSYARVDEPVLNQVDNNTDAELNSSGDLHISDQSGLANSVVGDDGASSLHDFDQWDFLDAFVTAHDNANTENNIQPVAGNKYYSVRVTLHLVM